MEGWSALDWAIIQGVNDVVKILLEHGANVETGGRNNSLYMVASEGHEATVRVLLSNGADVNA